MNKRLLLLLIPLLFYTVSCQHFDDVNELKQVNDGTSLAIPLIQTQTSLEDLLEGLDDYTFLDTDEDGLILLRYKGDVVEKTSGDIFKSIEDALPAIPIPVTDTVFQVPINTPEGIAIDTMKVKTGTLTYAFQSYHEQDVTVKVRFPQTRRPDGSILEFSHFLNYQGSTPVNIFPPIIQIDLAEHSLVADDNGNLNIEYEAIKADGERDTVSNFFFNIADLTFSYAEGYFGNQLHDGDRDTIVIEFFESWTRGNVYFEDPKIYVTVTNSFGLPTRSIVNLFDIYTVDGDVLPLQSDAIDEGIDFAYPGLDEVGEEKYTNYSFTRDNSNIDVVLGSNPVALDYDVDAITNPDSNTAIRGFITENSRYLVSVEVELPIYGRASGFTAVDTFDIDLSGYDNVKSAEFKLITRNNLPLDVGMQLYFVDENNMLLDSLVQDPINFVEAAPVDMNGEQTGTTEKTTFITVDADKFDVLRQANRILLSASFSTNDNGTTSVKVYQDQEVEILLGVILESGGD